MHHFPLKNVNTYLYQKQILDKSSQKKMQIKRRKEQICVLMAKINKKSFKKYDWKKNQDNQEFLKIYKTISYLLQVIGNGEIPVGIYLLRVNTRNTWARCEICSKLTITTPGRHQWRRSCDFIVNFEHVSHLLIVFLLLTLNM